jgi:hypothetical protein
VSVYSAPTAPGDISPSQFTAPRTVFPIISVILPVAEAAVIAAALVAIIEPDLESELLTDHAVYRSPMTEAPATIALYAPANAAGTVPAEGSLIPKAATNAAHLSATF